MSNAEVHQLSNQASEWGMKLFCEVHRVKKPDPGHRGFYEVEIQRPRATVIFDRKQRFYGIEECP